jgi:hypothetical protein
MKICIKENEFNPSLLYQDWCTEEKALQMGYTIVNIDDKYSDCHFEDFNEDLTFSLEKYQVRKQKENENDYENKVVQLVRQKYNINQELAILRQRDSKPLEYQQYFDYVETCKSKAKMEVLNDNNTNN